ncbi:hypothetical protein HZC53_05025 [Candidatus Uhrbacteria bacterium]|nr:hypothetical protein [Candidatus Uhrbacteria bacterium]
MAFLAFGDVFRFQETEFVYLAEIDSVTYAAKILNKDLSRQLAANSEQKAKSGNQPKNAKLFCFVMLTTPEFSNRAAHVGFSDQNEPFDQWIDKIGILNEEDLNNLRKEIVESNGVPLALQELLK